ncbi:MULTISPECIES: CoA transferase [unclassified Pseudonocardia]|uniref:CaiB/BaiF CoA-transferase family protein n=1 Tax=unclassified Pseudonocardia TaxID=2619320 RepID=UPI0001FFE69F|nr:CoA transferase [Pseudonocardia sp. Ae707_Ps1]OLM08951.1 CAIB/BAIF family protein [Pseudonocardia sp. Ae707_Ps1]
MLTRVDPAAGPLAGLEVLEISGRPSGAYCARLLHLLGASVVRAAVPLVADVAEALGATLESVLHEGKRVVPTEDLEVLRAVAARCDLVVVDSREDDAADGAVVALTREVLAACPETTPVVDIAGLRTGLADGTAVPCAPIVATAASGMSWGIGSPDGPPLTLPYDLPDFLTGTEAAAASGLALMLAAVGTGEAGSRWDVTTTDVLSYYVGQIGANFLPYERPWRRDGARATESGGSYPAAMFPCRDGWVSIMCRTQREYRGLIEALGDPQWARQPGFEDSRVVARFHADEADPYLIAWTTARTRAEVFAAGSEHGFPVAPVSTIGEALDQEQFAHRGFFSRDSSGRRRAGSPFQVFESPTPGPARTSGWPAADTGRKQPLAGLRVLDLSWVWSGPMVTAALRDLGADVLKVEHRERADPARLRGRALRGGMPVEGPELEVTPYFNQMNHGKRSLAIDMGSPEGAELIGRLAAEVDVLVENMRPGALSRKGFDYESLAQHNPGLVMISMSMLGQSGPLSGIRGYAPVMSGLAGLDSVVGYDPAHLIGTYNPALGDPNGAGHALAALLAALVGRQRTGRGSYVDLSQVEALLSVLPGPILEWETAGSVPVPGNGHRRFAPYGTFACRDEDTWVSLAARTPRELRAVADLVGVTDDDPGLTEAVTAWAAGHADVEAADELQRRGVPAGAVVGYETALFGERAMAREVGTVTDHPWLGEQTVVTVPWKVDGHGFRAMGPAPSLGQHTDVVLTEVLGLGPAEIATLRAHRAIE